VCCALYVVVAVLEYGHSNVLDTSQMSGNGTMDTTAQIWWLAWTAHALPHLHSLFLTPAQNYPLGQNFGVNGSMLALGTLFTPITKLLGPVVTWNVLLRLGVVASALSMCLVLRRWTTWWPAAFVGGLLYGFSSYTVGVSAYLFLIFVPLPPLILLLLHEIVVRQQWRPGSAGVLLGGAVVLQFFISTEILAGTVIMGTIAVALVVIVNRRTLVDRWRYSITAFGYSLGVAVVLLAYPIWFTFAGPQHINGAPSSPADEVSLHGDLLSSLFPSSRVWLDPTHLEVVRQFRHANHTFKYAGLMYLGLPLVVTLIFFAVFLRKRRAILFAGLMASIAFILSLGPTLWLDGHRTSVALPFSLLDHLPALDGLLATRFALYTSLFTAGMFAIGIDELWRRLRSRNRLPTRASTRWRTIGAVAAAAALSVVVFAPLVPAHAHTDYPTDVPAFFASKAVDSIPPNSVVLAYPYPDHHTSTQLSLGHISRSIMLDQAVASMRFRLIGGYGWFPKPDGGRFGTVSPALLDPPSVQDLFDRSFLRGTAAPTTGIRTGTATEAVRGYLRRYNVETVIILPGGHSWRNPRGLIRTITAAIGPPTHSGGVTVWLRVGQRLASDRPR
jgi:hypothetical protein